MSFTLSIAHSMHEFDLEQQHQDAICDASSEGTETQWVVHGHPKSIKVKSNFVRC